MSKGTKPLAVMLFGPPGAGKGAQAGWIVEELGFSHLDTGREFERIVHDPDRQADPNVQRERQLFDSGQLNTPAWAREMVMERVSQIAQKGESVVLSGSPRTVFEAQGLLPLLERLYGKDQIYVFFIHVKPETSIFRNSRRRICANGHPLIWSVENDALTHCPKCGAALRRRTLDIEEAIRTRLVNYQEHTKPVFEYLRQRGIHINEIDGEPEPEIVHRSIMKILL